MNKHERNFMDELSFDINDINEIIELRKDPIDFIIIGKYQIDVYEELNKSIPYIIGVYYSVESSGHGSLSIINPYTSKLVAEFKNSYIENKEFCEVIIDLVTKYIPKAIVCIKKNFVGNNIIHFLLNSKISLRVYFEYEIIKDILKHKKNHYGVYVNRHIIDVMLGDLNDRIKNHKEEFVGRNITKGIMNFVQESMSIDEDSLISYLIAIYVLNHGDNLDRFGFRESVVDAL